MKHEEIRSTSSGSAGSISVTIKLPPKPLFLYDLNAGFSSSLFGNIKFALTPKSGTGTDQYFHTSPSVPSPGGNHASIVTWQGKKFINGGIWDLKVTGVANVSDSLYVNGSMEVLD